MKRIVLSLLALAGAGQLLAAEAGFKSLFNGKNLDGWDGDPALWKVEGGAIVGTTREDQPLPFNKFLIWRGGTLRDFELRVKVKLTGNNNSGIQYRSRELKEVGPFSIGGYQCDIHPTAANNGMLYDERGRGIVAQHGQKAVVDAQGQKWITGPTGPVQDVKLDDWNEYAVIAQGNKLTHKLNGKVTAEIIDLQEAERELEGLLAFQVHRGPSMRVELKDIRLKELPKAPLLTASEVKIPANAQKAGAPAPAAAKGANEKAKGGKGKAKAAAAAAPAPAPGANVPQWIWLGEPQAKQTVHFRKEFAGVNRRTGRAMLSVTCDNTAEVFINGSSVLKTEAWERPVSKDVRPQLAEGRNVIAVKAQNADGAAGLIVRLALDSGNGETVIVSDDSWKVSGSEAPEWQKADFNASGWSAARVLGPAGMAPWTAVTVASLSTAVPLITPQATPAEQLKVPPGFKVELLYSVPKDTQGSWVSMCVDDKGRLIVSDQYGGMYRVTVPPLGRSGPVHVEPIEVDMGAAQGLLYAFNSLYVVINDNKHGGRGLYRVRDTNGDDKFDHVERLKKFEESGGEHGPHAVVLGPDGNSLYIVVGNQTKLPEYNLSRVPEAWAEDIILPRIYGRGFMREALAPRGWIARTDPDGKHWEIIATGFRNQYDAAFNQHGELFTYDADMEWDFNTPWYRPTRVCHVVSGGEWGWRNGSAKWPPYYPDSLPPVVDIGPGSPTGVAFGYGAKFPAKYQQALYILDWSYGKLYAVHLQPDGSTYSGSFEEFITGSPLPLTDIVVNPKDQAMYFTVGGRRVQSGLYRVTYAGKEPTTTARLAGAGSGERALRERLEYFHGYKDLAAVKAAWPQLDHKDRFIRSAARVAVEHQYPVLWEDMALKERNPRAALAALLALVRVGEKALQPKLLAALERIDWNRLPVEERLELLRLYQLTFLRMGEPDTGTREIVARKLDRLYPADDTRLNRELCQLLVYLQWPATAAKTVALLRAAPTQEEQITYAMALRLLKEGWTLDLRREYLSWFHKAAGYRGGANFAMFMDDIKKDAHAALSDAEKLALKDVIEKQVPRQSPLEAMSQALAGRAFVKEWKVEELAPLVERGLKGRNFERGRQMFGAAACSACHRFGQEGGAMGPDLTSAGGKFSARDLLESIITPSKEVSDQYAPTVFTLASGDTVTGRVVNLNGDSMRVNTDMFDPDQAVNVDRRQVKSTEPSKVSMMPEGLINMLKQDEILDLLAYLVSGGDRRHAAFR
jgi:putative heme-binding domain-containing protein